MRNAVVRPPPFPRRPPNPVAMAPFPPEVAPITGRVRFRGLPFPVSVAGFSAAASPQQQPTEYQKEQVFIPGVWPLLQR